MRWRAARAPKPIEGCAHLAAARERDPLPETAQGCQECLELGETAWAHLRLCMDCGHVGCCDSSPHRHASRHHESSGHPVMRSYEPGESWLWCYVDETMG